jgi:prevent-host-death family protein
MRVMRSYLWKSFEATPKTLLPARRKWRSRRRRAPAFLGQGKCTSVPRPVQNPRGSSQNQRLRRGTRFPYAGNVRPCHTRLLEVPITQFRREIFDLMNRALQGESILVTNRGQRIRIVPEVNPATRFDRLTPMEVVNPAFPDLDDAEMKAEMQAAWEKD